MTMQTSSRTDPESLTIEEYARLREPDDIRSELVRGRLVREPRPAVPHGYVQVELSRVLSTFVKEHGIGVVLNDVGVVLEEDPPTVRGPDVLFVSNDALGSPLPEGFLTVPPDLAVEIVSPSNTAAQIQERVLEYLDFESRMVWVIDPTSRTATVYRSRRDAEIVAENEELTGDRVIPGFRVRLAEVLPSSV